MRYAAKTQAQTILAALKATGWSKYRIAKALGLSWHTVYHWEKGHFEPNEKNALALAALEGVKQ